MTVRGTRRLIGLAAALAGAAAVAILAAGLGLPVEVAVPEPAPGAGVAAAGAPDGGKADAARAARGRPPLAEFERLAALDLRRPLYDPPAEPRVAAAHPATPLTVRLIGTVNEPGHSMAMLRKADGSVAVCALGEGVDAAGGRVTVTGIGHRKATVRYGGRSHELVAPPPGKAAAATPGKGGRP
jgi:hypothetical protein